MEPLSMTGLLDHMEHFKFIKRTADSSDRRAHCIYLTSQGIKIQKSVTEVVSITINKLFIGISDDEIRNIKHVLRHVLINSDKDAINDITSTT